MSYPEACRGTYQPRGFSSRGSARLGFQKGGLQDIASFKTPDLRNVLVTGPYFHDGSMQTLWDVMDHYNKGDGITNPWLDEDMQPLALTEPEIDDMVAFLALTDEPAIQGSR